MKCLAERFDAMGSRFDQEGKRLDEMKEEIKNSNQLQEELQEHLSAATSYSGGGRMAREGYSKASRGRRPGREI